MIREIDCAAEVGISAGRGGWTQVASGKRFYPLDPRPEDVNVEDIAHALGMKCRFGGHCKFFYSVAEHSVRIARRVGTLEALLHDAAEAYSPFGDVPRPLKADLPWVHTIECGIEQAIAARFGLTWPWPAEVKAADNAILHDERLALMGNAPADWGLVGEPLGVVIEGWDPGLAKALFLREFRRLTK